MSLTSSSGCTLGENSFSYYLNNANGYGWKLRHRITSEEVGLEETWEVILPNPLLKQIPLEPVAQDHV